MHLYFNLSYLPLKAIKCIIKNMENVGSYIRAYIY